MTTVLIRIPNRKSKHRLYEIGKPVFCLSHTQECRWVISSKKSGKGFWKCDLCFKDTKQKQRAEEKKSLKYVFQTCIDTSRAYSKKKNVISEVDQELLHSLWETQKGLCAITSEKMEQVCGTNTTRNRNRLSIDRKDPNKGYTKDNVWLVCEWVNRAKNDLSKDELLTLAYGIIRKIV